MILSISEDKWVPLGEAHAVSCNVTGIPNPEVSWSKFGYDGAQTGKPEERILLPVHLPLPCLSMYH
jgi:hypothetical protein